MFHPSLCPDAKCQYSGIGKNKYFSICLNTNYAAVRRAVKKALWNLSALLIWSNKLKSCLLDLDHEPGEFNARQCISGACDNSTSLADKMAAQAMIGYLLPEV
jgi:hypothetical protein